MKGEVRKVGVGLCVRPSVLWMENRVRTYEGRRQMKRGFLSRPNRVS